MKEKLLKLAESIKCENEDIYNKLLKIAKKFQDQKTYLLIDIKEMESMIDPDKVEEYKGIGRIELEV
tara:strand:- start:288 stop:488 length:201 start_codon:yes stop_codon:yes gene_type:complete